MRANVAHLASFSGPEESKQAVFEFLGDLDTYTVLGDRVLVATYIPPNKSKGGILFVDSKQAEARFTGPVGLVLKLGSNAFEYDGQFKWEGVKPVVGDWVQFSSTDAREFFLGPSGRQAQHDNGISCRTFRSDQIVAIIDDPQRVGSGGGFENLGG